MTRSWPSLFSTVIFSNSVFPQPKVKYPELKALQLLSAEVCVTALIFVWKMKKKKRNHTHEHFLCMKSQKSTARWFYNIDRNGMVQHGNISTIFFLQTCWCYVLYRLESSLLISNGDIFIHFRRVYLIIQLQFNQVKKVNILSILNAWF